MKDLFLIARTKLFLLDKFMAIRSHAPKSHALKMTSSHVCLWATFEAYYNRLTIAEIAVTPPLFIPEQPQPIPSQPGTHLFLGDSNESVS
jgi:hypothetical protein